MFALLRLLLRDTPLLESVVFVVVDLVDVAVGEIGEIGETGETEASVYSHRCSSMSFDVLRSPFSENAIFCSHTPQEHSYQKWTHRPSGRFTPFAHAPTKGQANGVMRPPAAIVLSI